jgi:hypothetical protein
MPTYQLLQMPAVHTDRFSNTGFVFFTAQGTVIKQNLQTAESNISNIYGLAGHHTKYALHSALNTVHYTKSTVHYTLYTVNCTLYTIFLSTKHILFFCPVYNFHCKYYCGAAC